MERADVLRAFRESFGENEITIKTIDPVSLHLIALDGRRYAEREDHSIVRVDGRDPLPVRFYTTASHGGGLTLKPRFVYLDGAWRSAIDGSREADIVREQEAFAMYETILNKYGPDQLSYTVKDIDAAVQEFYELFGAGPFIKMGPMHYESCEVRGEAADPEIVIALGMWGTMQVEFVQKLNDEPMLFDECGYGFNHVNVVVDNFDEAIKFLEEKGYAVGQMMTSSGKPIAYVDTAVDDNIGHHLEIHEYNPVIEMTKKAREIWDGESPWIDLQTVIAAMQ